MREIANDPRMIATGSIIFKTCAGCHGAEGQGVIGVGPKLNSETFLAAASDDFLIHTISNGRAGTTMIAWSHQYSRDEIYSVISYIRSWGDVPPANLDEHQLSGHAKAGEQIFSHICAGCHGAHGGGYQETANGTGIGREAFLSVVSNGYLRYIIKYGKSGSKMRPFSRYSKVAVANLDDQQIEDVIVYLRANAW